MRCVARITIHVMASVLLLTGCQSRQSKIDDLQKEHDRLSQQYHKDCGSEYLKAKPEFSQKCLDEAKQMDDVWKKLQQEKAH
ncbi:MAG TPA: hypothetical protein VG225_16065 [Terracidiphilus sp.]|jgi:hypothetical protein|nr:hypothetical protein [Terracidiphilus sp.]